MAWNGWGVWWELVAKAGLAEAALSKKKNRWWGNGWTQWRSGSPVDHIISGSATLNVGEKGGEEKIQH